MTLLVQRTLLFSILFFIISQFGKHFWFDFSYVSGIRVDYLSPTLYITDILIGLLFIISIPSLFRSFRKRGFFLSERVVFGFLVLIVSLLLAPVPVVAFYGVVKLVEMIFLGYIITQLFSKKDFPAIAQVFSVAVFIQSILVFWQFFTQSSVGGLWYFIGERTFSPATIGISTVSLYGKEILRAYGSFPHPNVLAFFMFSASLLLIVYSKMLSKGWKKSWIIIATVLAVICLFLTFSRLTILIFILTLVWLVYSRTISSRTGGIIVFGSLMCIAFLAQRFAPESFLSTDFTSRIDLATIALTIIQSHMIFGVGLLNYFPFMLEYQTEITPVLLQPVHNIYLLVLLQVGILGAIPVSIFLVKTVQRVIAIWNSKPEKNAFFSVTGAIFISILLIGVADHFFLTLQQGMLMTAVITGFLWISRYTKA